MRYDKTYLIFTFMCCMLAAAAFMSCSDDDAPVETADGGFIDWKIKTSPESRVGNVTDDNNLQMLCTPAGIPDAAGDNSERIGLIADLVLKPEYTTINSQYFSHYLAYYDKTGGSNPIWDYYIPQTNPMTSRKKAWVPGAKLVCCSFFPAKYLRSKDWVSYTSTAVNFNLSYTTVVSQEDLLVGYNAADCDTRKDRFDKPLKDGRIIEIRMKHALSAIKFVFKSPNNTSNDKLTSCWLECDNRDNPSFAVAGAMSYQTKKMPDGDMSTPLYDKVLKWVPAGTSEYQYYLWKNQNGLPIKYNPEKVAVPYNNNNDATNSGSDKYCHNDGFIYVIPQMIPDDLYICFTTKNGGNENVIRKKLLMNSDAQKNSVTEWKYNNRYTYTLTLTEESITMDIDVEPWNVINSIGGIEF